MTTQDRVQGLDLNIPEKNVFAQRRAIAANEIRKSPKGLDRKFEDVNKSLENYYRVASEWSKLSPSVITAAGNIAAEKVSGEVKSEILKNYNSSGLKSRSGKLLSALQKIDVRMNRGGLYISMPKGLPEYEKSKSNPYTVFASLNYGAVRVERSERDILDLPKLGAVGGRRTRSVIGAAAKRTIKKEAFGGGASARALSSLASGRKTKTTGASIVDPYHLGSAKKTKSGSVKFSGGAVVIPPRNFWNLSSSQKERLRRVFIKALLAEFDKISGA
jgi:hypothetical protein